MTEMLDTVVEGCRNNDRAAQEKMFGLLRPHMTKICHMRSLPPEDADECVLDAMTQVFLNLDSYERRNNASFRTWAEAILKRRCADYHRVLERRARLFRTDGTVPDTPDTTPQAISELYMSDIMKFVEKMPKKYQTVFKMKEIDGYNYKEMSEILHEPESSVRVNVCRAKKWLRKNYLKTENI